MGSDLGDLVHEEGALIRQLEPALALLVRPGEGALLVSEELALDDVGGELGAMKLHEALVPPRRELVDRLRDQLFSRARLPVDQHGGLGGRDLDDLRSELLHHA